MKKIMSIATIVALGGILAIGCSAPEETGKVGATAGASSTAGSDASKMSDTKTDSEKSGEAGKIDEKKEDSGH